MNTTDLKTTLNVMFPNKCGKQDYFYEMVDIVRLLLINIDDSTHTSIYIQQHDEHKYRVVDSKHGMVLQEGTYKECIKDFITVSRVNIEEFEESYNKPMFNSTVEQDFFYNTLTTLCEDTEWEVSKGIENGFDSVIVYDGRVTIIIAVNDDKLLQIDLNVNEEHTVYKVCDDRLEVMLAIAKLMD